MQLGKLKFRKLTRIDCFGLGLTFGLLLASEYYGHRIPGYVGFLLPSLFSSISILVEKAAANRRTAEHLEKPNP